jgi:endonuclease YncB( thermonuclease family)
MPEGRGGVAAGLGLAGPAFMLCWLASADAQAQPRSNSACKLHRVGSATVTKVIDGRSFLLDDGREIRLPNIEVALLGHSGETDARAQAGSAARAALQAILEGQSVELGQAGPASDRYGRIIGDTFTVQNGMRRSAAQEMVARGFARVAAHAAEASCIAEFLAAEQAARRGKLGLWAEPYYAVVGTDSLSDLLAHRGQFTLVEGKVFSVRESGGTIYVNFGRRWSEALTVTIPKRSERNFVAAGLNPRKLENLRLRVRGWMETRNGPRLEVSRPEQIEIAER